MDKQLEQKLVADFPEIFQDYGGDPSKTCMAWGMSCGNGWEPLIRALCGSIKWRLNNPPRLQDPATKLWTILTKIEPVVALQVKEKLGGLRFYYRGGDNKIATNVEFAETLSQSICEECSTMQDITSTDGWIRYLCSPCKIAWQKDRIGSVA